MTKTLTVQEAARIAHHYLRHRTNDLASGIMKAAQGRVMSGPFTGLKVEPNTGWHSDDVAPKLLGTYEHQLHPFLAEIFSFRKPTFGVDIGCADGFYILGCANRLPDSTFYGLDITDNAIAAANRNAEINGNPQNAHFIKQNASSIGEYYKRHPSGRAFVLSDCEGWEANLPAVMDDAAKRRTDFIIEVHNLRDRDVKTELTQWLSSTHSIRVVTSKTADVNDIPSLQHLSDLDRYLCVAETRPYVMEWIIALHR
jgi:hypothetical protein